MTNKDLTHLVLILDRSGSMSMDGKAIEAEKGVRKLLADQRAVPGRLDVTVAAFDNEYELRQPGIDADRLDDSQLAINPRGMTALFDAVGKTVMSVGSLLAARSEEDRPGRVTVLVATDGLENDSKEWTAEALKALITEQTETYGWEFIFMGTSQEAALQAQAVGFAAGTTFSTSNTGVGTASGYAVASASLSNARYAGTTTEVTDEDRKNLK